MMKLTVKHLLPLYILLLGGFIYLGAQANQNSTLYPSSKIIERAAQTDVTNIQGYHASIIEGNASGTKKESQRPETLVVENEEETDKLVSFKKVTHHNSSFTGLSNALILGSFYQDLKKCLSSGKQAYYFTSNKWYILFHVFRI